FRSHNDHPFVWQETALWVKGNLVLFPGKTNRFHSPQPDTVEPHRCADFKPLNRLGEICFHHPHVLEPPAASKDNDTNDSQEGCPEDEEANLEIVRFLTHDVSLVGCRLGLDTSALVRGLKNCRTHGFSEC